MAATACALQVVNTVYISSRVTNLENELSKRCPKVEFIDVPVGCSGELEKLKEAKVLTSDPGTILSYLPKLPQLEWLQLTSAGAERVIKCFTPKQRSSLVVTRCGGVSGPAITQYVIGNIISWEREFRKLWKDQVNHEWDVEWRYHVRYRVMSELTIGILGLGDIGKAMAQACKALGMTVWGVGRTVKHEKEAFVDHYTTTSGLAKVLQSCDYVCNVLPSTPITRYLLSGNTLESGKFKKPVLINVGRGDIIDEKSLVDALNRGWLSGAILDVFEVEPLPMDSALWEMPQVVITPHMSGFTFACALADIFAENLALYEAGEKLKHSVDVERGY